MPVISTLLQIELLEILPFLKPLLVTKLSAAMNGIGLKFKPSLFWPAFFINEIKG